MVMIALDAVTIQQCPIGSLLYYGTGEAVGILTGKHVCKELGWNDIPFEYWSVEILTVYGAHFEVEMMEHDFFYNPTTLPP